MTILGEPLFIWFGICAATMMLVTMILGLKRKFRYHPKAAALTGVFVVLHLLGALGIVRFFAG